MELVQDETLRKDLRHAMETQFRYKLYHDPAFPYFPSLGIKDIIQGFANDEVGLVGFLHLHYTTEKGKIGLWKSSWYDSEEEGTDASQAIVDSSCFDAEKVTLMLIREQLSKIKAVEEPTQSEWPAEINTDKVLLN
jgi:hypothetical protein